jgi:hypothetical protein
MLSSSKKVIVLFVLLITSVVPQELLAGNTWSNPPSDLSAVGGDSFLPQIVLSADGTKATAVWSGYDGSNWIIQSRSATISGTTANWGPVNVLSIVGQDAYHPQVVISADGTKATAIWSRQNGADWIIQSRSATISATTANWGPVNDLSTAGGASAFPKISLSADGTKATAIWNKSNGSNDIIQTSSSAINGGSAVWGAVTDLSVLGNPVFYAQISLSSDGTTAMAIWYDSQGASAVIQSGSATVNGPVANWGPVTDLSEISQSTGSPQVKLSNDGTKATAVWYYFDGTNWIIRSKSATVSGLTSTWGGVSNLSATGQDAFIPQIGLSADGAKATVVWTRGQLIQSTSATINGINATWGVVSNLSADGQNAYQHQIGLSADGSKATVVWTRGQLIQSTSATINGINATWGVVSNLSADGQNASQPQVGLSADGDSAIAIWMRNNGSNDIIQSSTATSSASNLPNPIPTLSELSQIMMMLLMIATAGFYGWRMKQR